MWKASVGLTALAMVLIAAPAAAGRECKSSDRECKAERAAKAYRSSSQERSYQDNSCRGRNDNECATRDPLGTLRDLAGRPINPDGIRH